MSEELNIEFEWIDRDTGNEIDRAFAAYIEVAVGDRHITRIDDSVARTVRNRMRGSAWHLAIWFAANWWRLRWEPTPRTWLEDANWRMSHSMAGAGGGYVWPDAVFASDGESIEIAARPNARSVLFEPIRYINDVETRIPATEFERKVDMFMASVLSRLDLFKIEDQSLVELWKEILSERRNPKDRRRRKLEAMAGYDPDEAPDEMIKQLIQDKERLGKDALQEVAAEARHETGEVLKFFCDLSRSEVRLQAASFKGTLPDLDLTHLVPSNNGTPWQRAGRLAKAVREKWGLGTKPILNKQLAGLLGAKPTVFTESFEGKVPMPLRCNPEPMVISMFTSIVPSPQLGASPWGG
ncbi:MAG: hypothetical protein WDN28_05030 [Chthoniobacter sp.]